MLIELSLIVQEIYQEIYLTKWFAKDLQRIATFLVVNNNYGRKLVPSFELPIIFDDNIKVSPISFFVADTDIVIENQFILIVDSVKKDYIYNTFTVPCEKSKIVLFTSSRKKISLYFLHWQE